MEGLDCFLVCLHLGGFLRGEFFCPLLFDNTFLANDGGLDEIDVFFEFANGILLLYHCLDLHAVLEELLATFRSDFLHAAHGTESLRHELPVVLHDVISLALKSKCGVLHT